MMKYSIWFEYDESAPYLIEWENGEKFDHNNNLFYIDWEFNYHLKLKDDVCVTETFLGRSFKRILWDEFHVSHVGYIEPKTNEAGERYLQQNIVLKPGYYNN